MIDLTQVPPELFTVALESNLRRFAAEYKLSAHFVEAVRVRLGADCAWLIPELDAVDEENWRPIVRGGAGARSARECEPGMFDLALAKDFLAKRRPKIPPTTILGRVIRFGRQVGLLGAVRRERPFEPADRRTLDRLAGVLATELGRRERERLNKVLDRIKEKIVAELRPRDLAYQILDGLEQLVGYDHSSAFLTWDAGAGVLRVEAEKIAWTKAKSAAVGREIPVSPEAIFLLQSGLHLSTEGDGLPVHPAHDAVRRLLDDGPSPGIPPIRSLLVAPLFFDDRFLGLLEVAAWKRRAFDDWDAEVVERFLPVAEVAIRNAQWNQTLENQAAQAEVKASLVTLARVVAHDVNNAVGVILPLAQQMQDDLRLDELVPEEAKEDLAVIVDRAQFCKRIFVNMLRAGSTGRLGEGPVDLNRSVRETVSFFEAAAARSGIDLSLALDPEMPVVLFSRQDLEHVLLNLVTNSLEALRSAGSRIKVETGRTESGLAFLRVLDDGPGIPRHLRDKVLEPFFSTKEGGHGLGLALCRSLTWQNCGGFEIESEAGTGTIVTVEMKLFTPSEAAPGPAQDVAVEVGSDGSEIPNVS
jgi:two-component system, NtrC family, sensor kinase